MRHNVFVSYHHNNDQKYKNKFEEMFSKENDILISKSVQIGDIDPYLKTETIRQKIRNEYLKDSTVTVVLIGSETWKRKHVDWEIGSSIRQTQNNSRSGLIGILLPSYLDFSCNFKTLSCLDYDKYTIPPRLSDNLDNDYAKIYEWSEDYEEVQRWIHEAFNRRNNINPDNSFPSFVNNRSGERWYK